MFKSHLLNQNRYNDLRNNWFLIATHTTQKMLRRWKMSSSSYYVWINTLFCCACLLLFCLCRQKIKFLLGLSGEENILEIIWRTSPDNNLFNRASVVSLPVKGTETTFLWAAGELWAVRPSSACSVGACLHAVVGSFYLLMPLVTMTPSFLIWAWDWCAWLLSCIRSCLTRISLVVRTGNPFQSALLTLGDRRWAAVFSLVVLSTHRSHLHQF